MVKCVPQRLSETIDFTAVILTWLLGLISFCYCFLQLESNNSFIYNKVFIYCLSCATDM